jgi:hypothetical protein
MEVNIYRLRNRIKARGLTSNRIPFQKLSWNPFGKEAGIVIKQGQLSRLFRESNLHVHCAISHVLGALADTAIVHNLGSHRNY